MTADAQLPDESKKGKNKPKRAGDRALVDPEDALPGDPQNSDPQNSDPENDLAIKEPDKMFWLVMGLHLAVVLFNLPALFFYFQRSWALDHYKFFPLAMLVFGYIVKERIDWGRLHFTRWVPVFCSSFLFLAFISFAVSTSEYNHYLPAVGTILVLGSLLTCLVDKETGGSLLPTWLLLVPLIRIPLNFDVTVITELQFFSAAFASNLLDFLGIPNYTPGTVIEVIDQGEEAGVKKFDVERACSGVQSLFTLIFCTLTVAVWARRSFVAGILLVMSGVFWSITMNGLRIVICVSAYFWFDIDVYSGFQHEVLGYVILLMAIGLIASSDALIAFVVSPIEISTASRNYLATLWNRLVAGSVQFRHQHEVVTLSGISRQVVLGVVLFGSGLASLAAANLFLTSVINNKLVGIVRIGNLELTSQDIPERIRGKQVTIDESGQPVFQTWTMVDESLDHETRNPNSTYGPYSTGWVYQSRPVNDLIKVSFDYTFLGWHELKVCYRGAGWKIERVVFPDDNWKPVELYLRRDNGESGYCVFSIFDYQGNPVEPLSDNLGFFWLRLKNRINRELSTTTTFQIQCLIQDFDKIPKARIEATRELHLKIREEMRDLVLKRLDKE